MTGSDASDGRDGGELPASPPPGGLADDPRVSVVIPTYNDVTRIGDALSSIVAQTTVPSEIVVCDDGSDDGTEEFVRQFADASARGVSIRYLRLPGRSGPAAARNAGVALASGEWIAACDSDDMWVPAKLERQLAFLREWHGRRPIAVLGCHGYNVNDAKQILSAAPIGPTSEVQYDQAREQGKRLLALHSSILFPRADFDAIGGYSDEYGPLDDADFICRMGDRGVVICLPEPLVYYRKRSGSAQLSTFWSQRENAWRLMENQRRRARGEAPVSREQFAAQLAAAPMWRRLRRRKRLWGLYFYRLGATDIVNGHRLRGAARLALSSILSGRRVRAGVEGARRLRRSRESAQAGG